MMTGCKFDKQGTYTEARGRVLVLEEVITGDGEMLVDVGSQYDVRYISQVIQQPNDAGCLKEEARAAALIPNASRSVRADFEENKWDVTEAEEEEASGFVAILEVASTVSYLGNQWKLPGLATRENRLTCETDDGAGWELTRNRMICYHQDIAGN
jgi:hypothetical protein